jgi:phosphohistidine swiveling domain-containing protein
MKMLLTHTDPKFINDIGGKAKNLFKLNALGINVPKWAVIPQAILVDQLTFNDNSDHLEEQFKQLSVPKLLLEEIATYFGDDFQSKTFAVRSSAIDEDGAKFSFAGQFETFLHVRFDEIESAIKKIWASVNSERVLKYRAENKLPVSYGIGVIVQEMISPEVAGVAFGLDPVTGNSETKVISSVYGLGEGLVSGELDADTFTLTPDGIEATLALKSKQFVQDNSGSGIHLTDVALEKQEIASLTDVQIYEITALLEVLKKELQSAQDIEFALLNDQVYLLQTRPITASGNEGKGEYILWDNSNIIESYPGITTPLTYSFILKMYEMVYRQFAGLMGVREQEINKHSEVYANTLGLVRGRVYYNLLAWYKMLAMVPGYSINAEFMENMMGVKERFELKEDFQMSKGMARFRIFKMIFKMIALQSRLPRERRRFLKKLNKIMSEFQSYDYSTMSPSEIANHYDRFERTLLLEWKAPLINDFFAMIWFGILQKKTAKYCPDQPNIHNDLLCGSQDIISVEPIHRSMALSKMILSSKECTLLFKENSPQEIWKRLEAGKFPEIKSTFDEYIDRFGNRCVGELKLETISYAQNPALFVKIIQSYVAQNITERKAGVNIEDDLRKNSEEHLAKKLKGKFLKRWWFNYIKRKARDLVSNRENLRYERTRGFGMVRTMFTALGEKLHALGSIDAPRDVFYLELDEILALKDLEFDTTLRERIQERKSEFEGYKEQNDPEERFFTYGTKFTDEYIYSKEKMEPIEGDLKGIGCCPGRIQAKVRIVKDPNEIDSLNGDILVTSSTDPGWVTLFPTASAIIVERGSLLSHSAIVSREMGIPCIVSVTGLLRTLKTGDIVLMDGSTGEIQIIEP